MEIDTKKMLTHLAALWSIDARKIFGLEIDDTEKLEALVAIHTGRRPAEVLSILRAGGKLSTIQSSPTVTTVQKVQAAQVIPAANPAQVRKQQPESIDSITGEIFLEKQDEADNVKKDELSAGDVQKQGQPAAAADTLMAGMVIERDETHEVSKKKAFRLLGLHRKEKTKEEIYKEYATVIRTDLSEECQRVIIAGINAGMPKRSLVLLQKKRYSAQIMQQMVVLWIRLAGIEAKMELIEKKEETYE